MQPNPNAPRRRTARPARKQIPEGSGGFSLPTSPKVYWAMFRERWWIGLPVGLICAFALAFYLLLPKPPEFQTRASLNFERRSQVPFAVQGRNYGMDATEMNNHMEQLRSQRFRNYLTTYLSESEKDLIQRGYKDPENPDAPLPSVSSIIASNMRLGWRYETTILDIRITNRDPEAARFVANTVAERYIEFNREQSNSEINAKILKLRSLEKDWRQKVEERQKELSNFRKKYNISRLEENQNEVHLRESSLQARLVALPNEILDLQTQLKQVEQLKNRGADLYNVSFIASFGNVSALRSEIAALKERRLLMEERYLEQHPRMLENELLLKEKQSLYEKEVERAILALNNSIEDRIQQQKEYREEINRIKVQARELDAIRHEYELMEREYNAAYSNLDNIIKQIDQELIVEKTDPVSITLFEPAYTPSAPAETSKLAIVSQAAGVGFFIWIIIPIGLGLMDTRVKGVEDIEDKLKLTLLAGIQRMRQLKEEEMPFAVMKTLNDDTKEAFSQLYSQISLVSTKPYPKRMLVTSTIPNEGKSLVAVNLASTFAGHEKKTILVDCDFRRPSLNSYLKMGNTAGTLKWITSEDMQSSNTSILDNPNLGIVEIEPNLHFLRTGGRIKNPTEYFEKISAAGLWEKLSAHYDVVMVDTPPVGIFPDALLIGEHMDEILYVCRFNNVKRGNMKKIIKQFNTINTPFLGVIMNCIPRAGFGYYDYGHYSPYAQKYYKSYAK